MLAEFSQETTSLYLIPCQQLHNTIVNRANFFNVFFGGFFVGRFLLGFGGFFVCLGLFCWWEGCFVLFCFMFVCLFEGDLLICLGCLLSFILINRLKLEELKLVVSQHLSGL